MPLLHYAPLRYLSIIALTWLAVFLLTRSALLATHLADADVGALAASPVTPAWASMNAFFGGS